MSAQHLSEVCGGDSIDSITQLLKTLLSSATLPDTEDGSSSYLEGIWGYKDADGRTALHWAVALKNYDMVNKLIAAPYNAPVMTEDNDGASPFLSACMVGAPEALVKELLTLSVEQYPSFQKCPEAHKPQSEPFNPPVSAPEGTDPPTSDEIRSIILQSSDSSGNTPLLVAVSRGHTHIVKFLLENDVDLFHQNERGQSVLHRAVGKGNLDLVELLVRHSEKKFSETKSRHRQWMNLQDYRGDSALFYASMENNEEMGKFLLRHGADRELRNKEGKQFWEL